MLCFGTDNFFHDLNLLLVPCFSRKPLSEGFDVCWVTGLHDFISHSTVTTMQCMGMLVCLLCRVIFYSIECKFAMVEVREHTATAPEANMWPFTTGTPDGDSVS